LSSTATSKALSKIDDTPAPSSTNADSYSKRLKPLEMAKMTMVCIAFRQWASGIGSKAAPTKILLEQIRGGDQVS
jgi:hypothetical protein